MLLMKCQLEIPNSKIKNFAKFTRNFFNTNKVI